MMGSDRQSLHLSLSPSLITENVIFCPLRFTNLIYLALLDLRRLLWRMRLTVNLLVSLLMVLDLEMVLRERKFLLCRVRKVPLVNYSFPKWV